MTTTEVPTATCPSCRVAARPGTRFCVGCGAALAPVGLGPPAPPPPLAAGHTPVPAPGAGSRPVTALAALAVVLLLLCGVAVTLLVVRPFGAVAGPGVTAPAASGPAVAPAAADPADELQTLRRDDRAAATALAGSWVPQLSTKRPGLVAEGRTWDAASILAEHRELRARYPQARLVWSGDYASFRGDDFWVTLLADPSSTAAAANAWCDDAGLDGDHCYAKRLSTTGGPDGNAVQRDGAEGSGGTSSGSDSTSSGSGATAEGASSGTDPYGCLAEREAQDQAYGRGVLVPNSDLRCHYNYGPTLPSTREQCWLAHHDLQDGHGFMDDRARRDYESGCSPFGF